jgi:hypothetical protein
MPAYTMKSGSPWLYDAETGEIVGLKDADGGEHLLPDFVISSEAPNDADGRRDGTIYIQTA